MNQTDTNNVISLEFQGKQYPCKPIENQGSVVYAIKFEKSILYITKMFGSGGDASWTAIPADSKLNHIVKMLGDQIDKINN